MEVMVLYLSFHTLFLLVFKTTVAFALKSLSGRSNETVSSHNFLPNPAMHDCFTYILTLGFFSHLFFNDSYDVLV